MIKNIAIAASLLASVALPASANAATNLVSAAVTGPSGTVWDTASNGYYALFLQQPLGNILNKNDNFAGDPTTIGRNNFTIFGDGFPSNTDVNSDLFYTLTLTFADGATINGQWLTTTNTFTPGASSTVGSTKYLLNGFGWTRSRADNVSPFVGVEGGDPSDYTGQFSFTATAVPEPATWAMMFLGFGMMGAAMRYRRRSTATVYA